MGVSPANGCRLRVRVRRGRNASCGVAFQWNGCGERVVTASISAIESAGSVSLRWLSDECFTERPGQPVRGPPFSTTRRIDREGGAVDLALRHADEGSLQTRGGIRMTPAAVPSRAEARGASPPPATRGLLSSSSAIVVATHRPSAVSSSAPGPWGSIRPGQVGLSLLAPAPADNTR
jgi:hypothetical protein